MKVSCFTPCRTKWRIYIQLNNKVAKLLDLSSAENLDNFLIAKQVVFLEKGINILDVKGSDETEFGIDCIEVVKTHEFDYLIMRNRGGE